VSRSFLSLMSMQIMLNMTSTNALAAQRVPICSLGIPSKNKKRRGFLNTPHKEQYKKCDWCNPCEQRLEEARDCDVVIARDLLPGLVCPEHPHEQDHLDEPKKTIPIVPAMKSSSSKYPLPKKK